MNTQKVERVILLSGVQKQRVAIARVKNVAIFISYVK